MVGIISNAVCVLFWLVALFMTASTRASLSQFARNVQPRSDCWDIANVTRDHVVHCLEVEVPVNYWDASDKRTAKLPVIFYPAGGGNTSQNDTLGTIWMHFGGPGITGLEGLLYGPDTPDGTYAKVVDAFYDHRFNIATWDPRGLNRTNMVSTCWRSKDQLVFHEARSMVYEALTSTEADDMSISFMLKEMMAQHDLCRDSPHNDTIRYMSSMDNVRDMQILYKSLGDKKLNFHAISYGSLLGQMFAKLYPDEVGRMVLDAIIDPLVWFEGDHYRLQADSEKAHPAFTAACERAGDNCALATLAKERGVSVLDMVASKKQSILEDGPDYALNGSELFVTYEDFTFDFRSLECLPQFWYAGAKLLADWIRGNATKAVLHDNHDINGYANYLYKPIYACVGLDIQRKRRDGYTVKSFRTYMEEVIQFMPTFYNIYVRFNFNVFRWPFDAAFQFKYLDHDWSAPNASAGMRNIVFMNSALDPMTAYRGATASAARFNNSILLKLNSIGHTTAGMPSRCLDEAKRDFMLGNITDAHLKRNFDPISGELLPSIVCEPDQKFEDFFAPPPNKSEGSAKGNAMSASRMAAIVNIHRRS